MSEFVERVGRRTFLKVVGAAAPAVAAAACSPVPPERIIPYVIPPEDDIPGVASWYASVCGECPAGCGLVVRTREGRPVKVEGNPDHPVNQGSLCIRGQASLQGLYDPDRVRGPRRREVMNAAEGQSRLVPVGWDEALSSLAERLRAAREAGGAGRIAIVTPLVTGALDRLIETWTGAIGGARRVRYEPYAYEPIRAASRLSFGRDSVPFYDFAWADVLLSFGADFVETWLSTVGYTRAFTAIHRLHDGRKSRFIHIDPRLSLTASNADEWIAPRPGTEALIALAMVNVIVGEDRAQEIPDADRETIRAIVAPFPPDEVARRADVAPDKIVELARLFSDPRVGPGRSLAIGGGVGVSGSNATVTQVAIHLLNYVAGNVGATPGRTVQFGPDSSYGRVDAYRDMLDLVASMEAGEVDVLILHDVNPAFTLPAAGGFDRALERVPFVVSLSSALDETAVRAHLVLPSHHPLESWGDVEPRVGVRGLRQPTIVPQFDSRHAGDMLLDAGRQVADDVAAALPEGDFYDVLRAEWATLQGDGETPFEDFWADALRRGGVWSPVSPEPVTLAPEVSGIAFDASTPAGAPNELLLMPYASLHFYDGRGANRAWLQEIPDPVTKAVWSSWAELHPLTASRLGAEDGQLVTIESAHGALEVPVLLNPHLHPDIVAVPIGQGHSVYGRYAAGRGINPIALLDPEPESLSGGLMWMSTPVTVTPRDVWRPVPRLQTTDRQFDRNVAQAVPLEDLLAGRIEPPAVHRSLYPDHEHPDYRWGMAIDLDACSGCNACVAACYAENNVPILGADAARRGRTMSWLRIERFLEPGPDTRFLPMLCQHCDHAPCETVCPVYATYHTAEGLNAQVYNRCVGTRYCSNNCPYKVRRFNWFEPAFPEPLPLQLNPDVTARSVGVMEKCTFCVQRIRESQDAAKDEDRKVRDGEVTPACAQTCPGQAIVFGNLNDPNSRVSQLDRAARGYKVFDTLNTRPAITYLKKILRTQNFKIAP